MGELNMNYVCLVILSLTVLKKSTAYSFHFLLRCDLFIQVTTVGIEIYKSAPLFSNSFAYSVLSMMKTQQ